ncbi:MAG: protein phosphatase 2C domain-containing protein [Candidatus Hermodarchaeota archaeon]
MDSKIKLRKKIVLLGKDYTVSEKIHLERFSLGAIGISIGPYQRHWHLLPNEDAGIILDFDDTILVAICDGHHGTYASETVIKTLEASYAKFTDCKTQNTFNAVIDEIITESYTTILQAKEDNLSSLRAATTFTLCLTNTSEIFWASMGDGFFIYQSTDEKPRIINNPNPKAFVGWYPSDLTTFSVEDNISKYLEKGKIRRIPNLQLVISSDGVPDYYPDGLNGVLSDLRVFFGEDPGMIVQKLFQKVIDQKFGDNLCTAVLKL